MKKALMFMIPPFIMTVLYLIVVTFISMSFLGIHSTSVILSGYLYKENALEFWAAVSGLWCVWLTVKEKISSYPVGIINIFLFLVMFYKARLYADATLQIVFLVLTVYGWYYWLTGNKNTKNVRTTRKITRLEWILTIGLGIIISYVWALMLSKYTDAATPYMDAPLAIFSVVAEFLLAKKILENWAFWVVIDGLSISMYLYNDLYITTLLYVVFFVMAAQGYYAWKKEPTFLQVD